MFEFKVLRGISIQGYKKLLTKERNHLETKCDTKCSSLRVVMGERVNPNIIRIRRNMCMS